MSCAIEHLRVDRLASVPEAGPYAVGESPVWHAAQDALYWVDITGKRIVRHVIETGRRTHWAIPEQVGCIAFDGAGSVLAAMESGLFAVQLYEPPAGALEAHASLQALASPRFRCQGMRFNDGRCDRQGRFLAGTMVMDMSLGLAAGELLRHDAAARTLVPVVDGLIVQNGLAWSPDGRTMYLSDSHPSRRLIWTFDYDVDAGVPHSRRVFADLNRYVGRPDGATVDEAGGYWICANDGAALLRFAPDGRLDRQIALPAAKPAMCAFGGKRLDTLYVTTIRPAGASAGEYDGHVLALHVGIGGIPEPVLGDCLPRTLPGDPIAGSGTAPGLDP
ncbi:gluconolactonase [Pandoraea terrae]|uniref:Gluconolactonase n=1 Tax=Pandoraea terrae TaxID=1537710 RepID=A0A5E4XJF4_9BURK|nr:SMP-30/gluconolactonase/LRE family protein [Pandoraea terrae]VVE36447.1 gluconolactonase [Pandoraea terrae]